MADKENNEGDINVLISALQEQNKIMRETFTENTNTLCETVKNIHRRDSLLFGGVFISFLIFLLILYLF